MVEKKLFSYMSYEKELNDYLQFVVRKCWVDTLDTLWWILWYYDITRVDGI